MIKTRSVVLHRFVYSDSSWIVKALTEDCGIVGFILKGAKRKDSPFKGALDPLALSEVVYRENPRKSASGDGGLLFVKEATLLDWRGNLRINLLSQAIAQVMAEILLKYAPQGVPLQEEFALLNAALDGLNQEAPRADTFSRWLIHTSDLWGYHLDLTSCYRCDCRLTESAADFHPETGGLLCKDCLGAETPRARPETLQGLWALRNQPGDANSQMDHHQKAFVENALLAYLRCHIGFLKDLKTLHFLTETRKLFPDG